MRMLQAHDRNRVTRVRFTPDARTLTVACRRTSTVNHLDPTTGVAQPWDAEWGEPYDIAYSADGAVVVVSSHDGIAFAFRRIEHDAPSDRSVYSPRFDFDQLAELPEAATNWDAILRKMAFAPTTDLTLGRLAAAGAELLLWNPHTQEYIVAPEEGDYRGVSFGPDGTTVASIEYHAHALCVWNVKPFRVLFRTDLRGINTFDNGSVAMMPDGERVILAAGELLRCVPLHGTGGWDTSVKKPPLEIALHPRGHTLLVADGSKKVTAYDTSNGKAAAQYDWGVGKVGCVTYSPDGTLAAAGGEKGQVVVWDAE